MHEKHIARAEYLKSTQRYMMELFRKRLEDIMICSLKVAGRVRMPHLKE